ncbi:Kinesin-related protein 1, partial [Bienertia sinuspersici]
ALGPKVLCYHNEVVPLKIVRHSGPGTCDYFRWAEGSFHNGDVKFALLEIRATITELENQLDMLQNKVKKLKKEGTQLQEIEKELSIKNDERMLAMEGAKMDKKLAHTLILSWVYCDVMLSMDGL